MKLKYIIAYAGVAVITLRTGEITTEKVHASVSVATGAHSSAIAGNRIPYW